jgi:hypothetical protein
MSTGARGIYTFSRDAESYWFCRDLRPALREILEWLDRDISRYYGGNQRDWVPFSVPQVLTFSCCRYRLLARVGCDDSGSVRFSPGGFLAPRLRHRRHHRSLPQRLRFDRVAFHENPRAQGPGTNAISTAVPRNASRGHVDFHSSWGSRGQALSRGSRPGSLRAVISFEGLLVSSSSARASTHAIPPGVLNRDLDSGERSHRRSRL